MFRNCHVEIQERYWTCLCRDFTRSHKFTPSFWFPSFTIVRDTHLNREFPIAKSPKVQNSRFRSFSNQISFTGAGRIGKWWITLLAKHNSVRSLSFCHRPNLCLNRMTLRVFLPYKPLEGRTNSTTWAKTHSRVAVEHCGILSQSQSKLWFPSHPLKVFDLFCNRRMRIDHRETQVLKGMIKIFWSYPHQRYPDLPTNRIGKTATSCKIILKNLTSLYWIQGIPFRTHW
jgi:hypothetical protein